MKESDLSQNPFAMAMRRRSENVGQVFDRPEPLQSRQSLQPYTTIFKRDKSTGVLRRDGLTATMAMNNQQRRTIYNQAERSTIYDAQYMRLINTGKYNIESQWYTEIVL